MCPQVCVAFVWFLGIGSASLLSKAEAAVPWYPQPSEWQDESLCGVNSLYVLLRLKGCDTSYALLRSGFDVHPEKGVSLTSMQKQAAVNGLTCTLLQSSPDAFKNLSRPFIAHLQRASGRGHYVLVVESDEETVQIVDGESQVRQMPLWQFEQLWTGYCLLPGRTMQWNWPVNAGLGIGAVMFLLIMPIWTRLFGNQAK